MQETKPAALPNSRRPRKGHLLAPFARILLAIAYVREKDSSRARELLLGLQREFPDNTLFGRELARLDKNAPLTRSCPARNAARSVLRGRRAISRARGKPRPRNRIAKYLENQWRSSEIHRVVTFL